MRCIYCNSEADLTSSDIITYAITGAKLSKSFVCHTHNALTNDKYEKYFVAGLDFFRNCLGLSTRDGKPIQFKADITVDGTEIHDVKISNRASLYAPKGVVAGVGDKGNKIIMAPMEKIKKISDTGITPVDISNVTLHKTISSDVFLGGYAVHSAAKMAYEWYCYANNIEELKDEYQEIVDYILGKNEDNLVDIVIDASYFSLIDQLSEVGTNAFLQYDDIDGYRYVIFDLWKTVAYRVKMGKSPKESCANTKELIFELFLYHIDGSKSRSVFGAYRTEGNQSPVFCTIEPQSITRELWMALVERIERIMSTFVLTINALKREVDILSSKLKKYDEGKLSAAQLLDYEENTAATVIEVIYQLYKSKEHYDRTKTFNQNLSSILNVDGDTITKTLEEKSAFLTQLMALDSEGKLSEYIWNGIHAFEEIYRYDVALAQSNK